MDSLDNAAEINQTLPDIYCGNDYPKSLGILDMLHPSRQPIDRDARFQVMKALIEFGVDVYSSSAPQVWDFMLHSVLIPTTSLLLTRRSRGCWSWLSKLVLNWIRPES